MSKSVKTIVTIAVAVAIPFVAPAIASSIGLSAAIGSTAGSALVGAGLGAVNAKLTGGDVGRGALIGGIGGGIAGYNYVPTPAAAAPATAAGSSINPNVLAAEPSGFTSGISETAAIEGAGVAGTGIPTAGTNIPTAGLSGVPVDASAGFPSGTTVDEFGRIVSATPESIAVNTSAGFEPAAFTSGISETAAIEGAGVAGTGIPTAATAAPAASAASAAPTTFSEALKQKFTDPRNQADLFLRAVGSIAGSLIAGDGLSNEEKQLLQEQTTEARELQQNNKALFDQKIQAAQDLIGESKYFDPEYFGLQRARRAQLAGARAKRGGLRGLSGSRRAAEERRYDLATSRDTGTAFDQGFMTGVGGRLQTMQAGLSAMPTAYPSADAGFTNLRTAYEEADARRRRSQSDFAKLYGTFTGIPTSTAT